MINTNLKTAVFQVSKVIATRGHITYLSKGNARVRIEKKSQGLGEEAQGQRTKSGVSRLLTVLVNEVHPTQRALVG